MDVGREIPVIVAINGRVSRYNTMFLNHFLPNITSIPKIPLLSGGPSSRLRLIVDEIGDYTTLPRLKVLVASEGASGCGGIECTSLSLLMQKEVHQDTVNIVNISTNGVFRTASGASALGVGDEITISGCIYSSTNNGNFIISSIVSNDITLVDKNRAPIFTATNKTGCKISRPNAKLIECLYESAGAKDTCMDVVLAADGQKSEPSTYCYGSDEQGAIVLTE